MKIFIQVIDSRTGIYQTGMINEPVQKGFEIANALAHFGANINEIKWISEHIDENFKTKTGVIEGTTKIISIVIV